jgi:alanine-synthesizing transaminase
VFSRRSQRPTEPNRLTRALEAALRDHRPLLDLTCSNPTTLELSLSREQLAEAYSSGPLERYEPESFGPMPTREAVGAHLGHPSDRLCLLASTSEAYVLLFGLFADPGERILVPRPSYPLFDELARIAGVTLEPYPIRFDGSFFVDRDALVRASAGCRAIVAISPNNPTGHYLGEEEHRFLLSLGLPLIVDEVFRPYPLERAPSTYLPREGLSISLGGFSKALALPQVKLGWAAFHGDEPIVLEALARFEHVADATLSLSTPTALAAPRLLDEADAVQARIRERCLANLAVLDAARDATSAWSRLEVGGGFTVLVRLPAILDDEEWALRFLDAGVVVQPGYLFDIEEGCYVALSLVTEARVFERGVATIAEIIAAECAS